MKRFVSLTLVLLLVHYSSTENVFENNMEHFINECKKEAAGVDSSESLESLDKNMTKCFTACLYTKLDLLSFDGEFNFEKLSHHLTIMGRYFAKRHKIAYIPEYVDFGIDCAKRVEEDDICELVSNFEECWNKKLIESITNRM